MLLYIGIQETELSDRLVKPDYKPTRGLKVSALPSCIQEYDSGLGCLSEALPTGVLGLGSQTALTTHGSNTPSFCDSCNEVKALMQELGWMVLLGDKEQRED